MDIFVSDLDGTLLNDKARISLRSEKILNKLAERGVYFTVASARTPLSAIPILKNMKLRLPVILLNGGMLYDMNRHQILKVTGFGAEQVSRIFEAEKKAGLCGMLLSAEERGGNRKLYLNLGETGSTEAERKRLWDGYFDLRSASNAGIAEPEYIRRSAKELTDACIIYGLYMDDRQERLAAMAGFLGKEPGLSLDLYRDIYTEDRWCLEITSGETSKKQGAEELKRMCGADRMIGFGDGENDISMLEAAGIGVAMENAPEVVKDAADMVARSNDEDGVAYAIEKHVLI